VQAGLKSQINKTDRNDARGIAQMKRGGWRVRGHGRRFRAACAIFPRRIAVRAIAQ
jgi:hypothetical protein